MAKFDPATMTTDSWKDSIGQQVHVGDLICVATISGRSPQMVIAQVERINTHNASGEMHIERKHIGYEEVPNPHYQQHLKNGWKANPTVRQSIWQEEPTVTFTARPLIDGRGFHRSKTKWVPLDQRGPDDPAFVPIPGGPKAVTYSILGNIIRLPMENDETYDAITERLDAD